MVSAENLANGIICPVVVGAENPANGITSLAQGQAAAEADSRVVSAIGMSVCTALAGQAGLRGKRACRASGGLLGRSAMSLRGSGQLRYYEGAFHARPRKKPGVRNKQEAASSGAAGSGALPVCVCVCFVLQASELACSVAKIAVDFD